VRVAELDLPAQVIVNQRSGVIVITGDVEISPGLVTHKDLVIKHHRSHARRYTAQNPADNNDALR